ncbi:anaerobic glycerol-3-phosphate dehydrogenase subunit C [Klebsiella pneumoniae]|uniref:Anaerobic glycerol-3-phosphate dehydrogenase subunit C n=1 Tax=Klebsiella pneumoniae TaxID=573 RepID=A0A2X1QQH9_KLEPN|nr:anaerobic glycerol-3-phosphate dehydrogenase subunit C [Klebsiella pneumoniae]
MNDTRFESCIKCTVCTTTCPVSRVNPRYPGPKQAGPDGERLRLKDGALYDEALKYCINCKRCEVACPSDVKIGDIIQRARAQYGQQKPTLRDAILSHTDLMGTLSTPFAPLVNAATGLKPVRRLLDATLNIDHRRTLPKYGFGTFRRAYRQLAARQKQYSEQVAFFHGCYVNYNHPQLGKDLIRVVNALGTGVQLLSKEKCCGVPLIANGFFDKARKQAQSNVAAMRENTLPIIATSSTCAFTLRDEYPHLLDVDNSDLRDRVELATPLDLETASCRQDATAAPAAAESGLSHPVSYGKDGLVAVYPRAAAADPRPAAGGAGFPVLRHRRHLRV